MRSKKWKTGKGAALSFVEWMSGFVDSEFECASSALDEIGLKQVDEISKEVRRAIDLLDESERIAIEGYHFMGRSPVDIAEELSISPRMFERTLRTAQVKMQNVLAGFVAERFGLQIPQERRCPICSSAKRIRAEKLIGAKQEYETWKGVIRKLRDQLGIEIETPQTLIGHQKYHQLKSKS